jgi:hypothetical protein
MKLLSRITTLVALLLAVALPAEAWAQGFEGTITTREITVTDNGIWELLESQGALDEEEEIDVAKVVFSIPIASIVGAAGTSDEISVEELTYHIKGTKMRVDGGMGDEMPGYAILDFNSGTFQLVNPSERMYLEMTKEDFEEMMAMVPDYGEADEPAEKAQVRPLGDSKEINGMRCKAIEIKTSDETTIAWVTDELGDLINVFKELESRLKSMGMFDEDEQGTETFMLVADHGFPVVEQTLSMYYGEPSDYSISEVRSIERTSISDDLFTMPAGYEGRSIMEMMRMFGGGN